MKYPPIVVAFCLYMATPGALHAQITLTNLSFPKAGDTLYFASDPQPEGIEISAPGANQTWDFTQLRPLLTWQWIMQPASEGSGADLFAGAEVFYKPVGRNGETYLDVTSSKVSTMGVFGEDPFGFGIRANSQFEPAVVERRAPLKFFDLHTMEANLLLPFSVKDWPNPVLEQLPVQADSLRIRWNVNRIDLVDAWGTLKTVVGEFQVLREKRTTITETRIDAKVPLFGWQDLTGWAIGLLQIENLGIDTAVSYHYFADNSKEPVVVLTLNDKEDRVLNAVFKVNKSLLSNTTFQAAPVQFQLFPNPAADYVEVKLSGLPAGNVHFTLLDLLGRRVSEQKVALTGKDLVSHRFDIASLSPGTYFLKMQSQSGAILASSKFLVH